MERETQRIMRFFGEFFFFEEFFWRLYRVDWGIGNFRKLGGARVNRILLDKYIFEWWPRHFPRPPPKTKVYSIKIG